MDLTALYCNIDDFWKSFKQEGDKHLSDNGKAKRGPEPRLSISEMMTIVILFHQSNMEFIHYELKKFLVFGIKANRLIAFSEEERKKGQYYNLNSLNFKDGEKQVIWLKDLAFPVALVIKIFRNFRWEHWNSTYCYQRFRQ